MYCKKCGQLLDETLLCKACGMQNTKSDSDVQMGSDGNSNVNAEKQQDAQQKSEKKIYRWLSWLSFALSLIPLYKGYDKIAHYNSGDYYPYKTINAYVGGDAYNYIINGNYATAYFVLAVGLALIGVGFLIVYYISRRYK